MKLCIKQELFSWGDKFYIFDEKGNDRYFAYGEILSWGKKLHICDMNDNEIAYIAQQVFSFLPRYFVYCNGTEIAEIVKEFTFFKPMYTINQLDWEIDGDLLSHDYAIFKNRCQIVSIKKEWFTWGDCYTLDVANSDDEIAALAVVLCIDCVIDSQRN